MRAILQGPVSLKNVVPHLVLEAPTLGNELTEQVEVGRGGLVGLSPLRAPECRLRLRYLRIAQHGWLRSGWRPSLWFGLQRDCLWKRLAFNEGSLREMRLCRRVAGVVESGSLDHPLIVVGLEKRRGRIV